MTLSDIIYSKTSQSPKKFREVRGGPRFQNKATQNTYKNTPKDDLDTFCFKTSHIHRWDFLGLQKLPVPTCTNTSINQFAYSLSLILFIRSIIDRYCPHYSLGIFPGFSHDRDQENVQR